MLPLLLQEMKTKGRKGWMKSAGVQSSELAAVCPKTSSSKFLLISQFFLAVDLTSCSLFLFSAHPLTLLIKPGPGAAWGEIRSPELPPSRRAAPALPIHPSPPCFPSFPARQGCPVLRDGAGIILLQLEFFLSWNLLVAQGERFTGCVRIVSY